MRTAFLVLAVALAAGCTRSHPTPAPVSFALPADYQERSAAQHAQWRAAAVQAERDNPSPRAFVIPAFVVVTP